jgi:geranylgeranyl reductase family protein
LTGVRRRDSNLGMRKVVIIGAGPGGAAAAVRLAQRGVKDVLLLDKDQFPRDKTCGSALSPNGVKLIDSLGIGGDVKRLGYRIHSLRVVTPSHREMMFTTDQAAIILLRKHFDNLLVDQAKKLGVQFRGDFLASALIREGGRVVGVRSRSGEEVRGEYALLADGAHSIFSHDPRPRRTISTLMGWWEDFDYQPGTMEMIFDKNLSPLYGWLFPEGPNRVNIGICIDGEDADGKKTSRNVREVFDQFLRDQFTDRLPKARQIGKFKGHPISYTTWVRDLVDDGALYLGEGGRMTHNATGEGIFHAMQSGCYAAEALSEIFAGASEKKAFDRYTWRCRQRFTTGFLMGHVLRGLLKTPILDWTATIYGSETVRRFTTWAVGSALAGSSVSDMTGAAQPISEFTPVAPEAANDLRSAAN